MSESVHLFSTDGKADEADTLYRLAAQKLQVGCRSVLDDVLEAGHEPTDATAMSRCR